MLKYTRRLGAPIALAAALILGAACSKEKKGSDSTALGADTTLNRDLALASRDTAAKPQLKDVPPATAAPSPVTRTPARTPKRNPPAAAPRPIPGSPATPVP